MLKHLLLIFSMFLLISCEDIAKNKVKQSPVTEQSKPVISIQKEVNVKGGDIYIIEFSTSDKDGEVQLVYVSQKDELTFDLQAIIKNDNQLVIDIPDSKIDRTIELTITAVNDSDATTDQTITINVSPSSENLTPPNLILQESISALELSLVNVPSTATDSDGEIVHYLWKQNPSDAIQLNLHSNILLQPVLMFTAPEVTQDTALHFELTVTDNDKQSTHQFITVMILNNNVTYPISTAQNFTSFESQIISLIASTPINDSDIKSIKWTQISGMQVMLNQVNLFEARFSAPNVESTQQLSFKVELTDIYNTQTSDTITVTIQNITDSGTFISSIIDSVYDQALKQCILDQVGTYTYEITEIHCNTKRVSDTSGLYHFENLTNLNFSNPESKDAENPFSYVSNQTITAMNLSNNNLSELNTDNMENIKQLDVSGNPLNTLDFSNFDSLQVVNLTNTNISCESITSLSMMYPNIIIQNKSCELDDTLAQNNNYNAHKTNYTPVIDGIIDESIWEVSQWQAMNVFWMAPLVLPTADDYSGKFKIIWDENYIYLLFEIIDEFIDAGTTPNHDTIELFVDENQSGGEHTTAQNSANAFAYHVGVDGVARDEFARRPVSYDFEHIHGVMASYGDTHIWEIKMKIYSDSFNLEQEAWNPTSAEVLYADKILGFSAAYIDGDGTFGREHFIGTVDTPEHHNNDGWLNADGFGTLTLLDE
ncbi:sugar-binding protein [Marinicellulosiphila megalodicopiae]|uniref:sugar-binding protein n=1 Tax=Marinicellulosiphila megalodicopiae TaxID=2724896 RepID=UPI003BAF6488